MEDDANIETDKKIEDIKKLGKEKGNKVVEDLLNAVTNVKLIVPEKS